MGVAYYMHLFIHFLGPYDVSNMKYIRITVAIYFIFCAVKSFGMYLLPSLWLSVHLYACIQELEKCWTDFHEINSREFIEICVHFPFFCFKLDQNNGHFIWGTTCIYLHIASIACYKYVEQKSVLNSLCLINLMVVDMLKQGSFYCLKTVAE